MRTLIFIPAFNEEQTVADVVRDVRTEIPWADVLVIDDGSTDRTAHEAREAGAWVISLPENCGLGASLQTGYRFALRGDYDIAAHMDADGQHLASEMRKLIDAVAAGECDMALGSRFLDPSIAPAGAYTPSFTRRIGIGLFRSLLTSATGQTFTDSTSGFRASNRRVIETFSVRYGHDYPELESLTRLVRSGGTVKEVPVVVVPRKAGASKITPLKSVYWVFNGLVSLSAARLRPRTGVEEGT